IQRHPHQAALGFLPVMGEAAGGGEGCLAGEKGDAVVALLAVKDRLVAEGGDLIPGKEAVFHLGLLEADHRRLVLVDHCPQLVEAGPQAVDVEGYEPHCACPASTTMAGALAPSTMPSTRIMPASLRSGSSSKGRSEEHTSELQSREN